MQISPRTFSGEKDLRAMEALSRECRADCLHVTDLPYRFSSWGLVDPENVCLWHDGTGELLGWMVMQIPFIALDFACRPKALTALLPKMLDWADEHSRAKPEMVPLGTPEGKPCWFVNEFADSASILHILEDAGFKSQADVGEDSWTKVFMQRPMNLPLPEFPIPEGFVIRPLDGIGEVEAYVNLHQATFQSKIMSVDWRRRTVLHPDHIPDLDLVVEAPGGRLAAFCICWLDRHGPEPIGQVEPLGVHPDFRHHSLGHAILSEGIRRMQAFGAKQIYVETDNWRNAALGLYESMGFRVVRDVLVYRKDY